MPEQPDRQDTRGAPDASSRDLVADGRRVGEAGRDTRDPHEVVAAGAGFHRSESPLLRRARVPQPPVPAAATPHRLSLSGLKVGAAGAGKRGMESRRLPATREDPPLLGKQQGVLVPRGCRQQHMQTLLPHVTKPCISRRRPHSKALKAPSGSRPHPHPTSPMGVPCILFLVEASRSTQGQDTQGQARGRCKAHPR